MEQESEGMTDIIETVCILICVVLVSIYTFHLLYYTVFMLRWKNAPHRFEKIQRKRRMKE